MKTAQPDYSKLSAKYLRARKALMSALDMVCRKAMVEYNGDDHNEIKIMEYRIILFGSRLDDAGISADLEFKMEGDEDGEPRSIFESGGVGNIRNAIMMILDKYQIRQNGLDFTVVVLNVRVPSEDD